MSQKTGFLLIELSFAQNVREKRHVVVVVSNRKCLSMDFTISSQKHLDAFASAFGFFLIGFDFISQYSSPQKIPERFFELTDPVLWFFKVTRPLIAVLLSLILPFSSHSLVMLLLFLEDV